jgi:hypothetical protein
MSVAVKAGLVFGSPPELSICPRSIHLYGHQDVRIPTNPALKPQAKA